MTNNNVQLFGVRARTSYFHDYCHCHLITEWDVISHNKLHSTCFMYEAFIMLPVFTSPKYRDYPENNSGLMRLFKVKYKNGARWWNGIQIILEFWIERMLWTKECTTNKVDLTFQTIYSPGFLFQKSWIAKLTLLAKYWFHWHFLWRWQFKVGF